MTIQAAKARSSPRMATLSKVGLTTGKFNMARASSKNAMAFGSREYSKIMNSSRSRKLKVVANGLRNHVKKVTSRKETKTGMKVNSSGESSLKVTARSSMIMVTFMRAPTKMVSGMAMESTPRPTMPKLTSRNQT